MPACVGNSPEAGRCMGAQLERGEGAGARPSRALYAPVGTPVLTREALRTEGRGPAFGRIPLAAEDNGPRGQGWTDAPEPPGSLGSSAGGDKDPAPSSSRYTYGLKRQCQRKNTSRSPCFRGGLSAK